ncbi:MAG: FMN-binding protein [Lentisphaeria bacterium]
MKDILKFCLSLGFFCAIAGGALAYVNQITAEPRQQAEQIERNAKLKLVLPADTAKTLPENPIDKVQFFRAINGDGKLLAYAAEGISNKGFGGELRVLTGISTEGKILAVMVSKQSETPGIGSQATERKASRSLWQVLSGKAKTDPFPANTCLDSYAGKSLAQNLKFGTGKNGVMAISGATVSSKAVLDAVNNISQAWQKKYSSIMEAK